MLWKGKDKEPTVTQARSPASSLVSLLLVRGLIQAWRSILWKWTLSAHQDTHGHLPICGCTAHSLSVPPRNVPQLPGEQSSLLLYCTCGHLPCLRAAHLSGHSWKSASPNYPNGMLACQQFPSGPLLLFLLVCGIIHFPTSLQFLDTGYHLLVETVSLIPPTCQGWSTTAPADWRMSEWMTHLAISLSTSF